MLTIDNDGWDKLEFFFWWIDFKSVERETLSSIKVGEILIWKAWDGLKWNHGNGGLNTPSWDAVPISGWNG